MSREIKFKAWNGRHWFTDFALSNDGRHIYETGDKYNTWDEVTLCQWTGLQDENKNDIYESDLMDTEEGMMEVFFIDGKFILMWADNGTYRCDLSEACNSLEVCGNKLSELIQK